MRYVHARYHEFQRERAYRIYVTDCLRTITENTAKFAGGTYITSRFFEVYRENRVEDARAGEEIAADIINRAGLVVKNESI